MTVIIVDNRYGVMVADRAVFRNGLVQPTTKLFSLSIKDTVVLACYSGTLLHRERHIRAFLNKEPIKDNTDGSLMVLGFTDKMKTLYTNELYGCTDECEYTTYILDNEGMRAFDIPVSSNLDTAEYVSTGYPDTPSRTVRAICEMHRREIDYLGYGFNAGKLRRNQSQKDYAEMHGVMFDTRFGHQEQDVDKIVNEVYAAFDPPPPPPPQELDSEVDNEIELLLPQEEKIKKKKKY